MWRSPFYSLDKKKKDQTKGLDYEPCLGQKKLDTSLIKT
jgi:hypothetical protein